MSDTDKPAVPGKVQAIGIMHLVGGIMNLMASMAWGIYGLSAGIMTLGLGLVFCCPVFLLLPIGIIEIISGAKHLSKNHEGLSPPKMTGIIEILSILGCGMMSAIFGILTLVFLSDPEVEEYYARNQLPGY